MVLNFFCFGGVYTTFLGLMSCYVFTWFGNECKPAVADDIFCQTFRQMTAIYNATCNIGLYACAKRSPYTDNNDFKCAFYALHFWDKFLCER